MSQTDTTDSDLILYIEAAHDVNRHHQVILGPEVEMLEKVMARWLQTEYAIGCNSGFGALLISLFMLNLRPGAQVVVPVLAPSDDIGLLVRQKLIPVLVDINRYDFQMNVSKLSSHLNDTIDAIIVYDLFGSTMDMETVMNIAGDIPVIDVLTNSLGAFTQNHPVSRFGTVAITDLRTTMGAWGDVGMIWTNDLSRAEKIREIRSENGLLEEYRGITSGNFHQDTIHAAFLLRKFEVWKRAAKKRSAQIATFVQVLRDYKVCEITIPEFNNHNGTDLVILAEHRDELIAFLQRCGITASTCWSMPIHLQSGFQDLGYIRGDFPQAEWVIERLLQLPVPENEMEIECLVESIVSFYGK